MRSFSHDFDRRPPVLRSAHSRRTFLKGIAATALAGGIVPFAHAAGRTGLHALSIFGDVKYPRDFAHLDYVNPAAPKGGKFTFIPGSWGYNQNPQTFNTMNGFAAKGDGPMGMDICFDSLVSGTADEPDTVYGLIAKTIDVSEDRNTFTFHMREEARFADGMPILAEDVVWSVATLTDTTKGHPSIGLSLGNLSACRALDALTVEFVFDGNQSLLQPFSAASLPVFSKAFFADRDFVGNTMDPPLGSGAYRVGRFKPGEFIEYERREDYWGKALPINIGQGNFDIVRIEFFREGLVAFQAFTKGDLDFRLEYISRNWVQKYDFDAVKKGKVIKTIFPSDKSAYMQAFFINTRRPQFADGRTREALGLAFDFEWLNQNQFFGAYTRSTSTFATSTFQAEGKPEGAELALLEPFREELDPRVFDEAVIPPVSDGSGRSRDNLRKASELLSAAGWERRNGTLAKPDGTELNIEFLMRSQDFERIVSGFITNLTLLGIKAQTRLVDAAQYQDRLKTFDFDITGLARRFSATPLEDFRSAFHSTAAVLPGSSNYCGIKLAAVDAMIEAVESARSRAEMETAARALDRILRAHFFTIPNWHLEGHRTAYWNKFSFPDVKKPDYGFPFLSTWWYDKDKAAKL
ncbi:MAG: ABC transporter substrate-binding protein [Rhizobiales bacterium]|nr:ABC transporter substrate-binding protein [Hyphomicrobiales bacterium]